MTNAPAARGPLPEKVVYIAYTGGTIGMRRGSSGYEPVPGYLAERLAAMPELEHPDLPRYVLHEYSPLLDSSNVGPVEWEMVARDIAANYHHFDGFVVLHGTDTMAYSASALSFMLEGLAKPVLLTGSQIPLVEVRSDARENLITSMMLAASGELSEVCLYLNGALLRGNRATKVSVGGFDAFESPNFPLLGRVGIDVKLRTDLLMSPTGEALQVRAFAAAEVAALRLFPGISANLLERLLDGQLRGVVLETFGAGNAPARDGDLIDALREANKRGVVLVNCTQCLRGAVDMSGYATGRALAEAGVVSGGDMTVEAALAKLSYLLSLELPAKRVRQMMSRDLRGEITTDDTTREPPDAAAGDPSDAASRS
ncbi:MAG: asparaginase [Trueperaceae bacterium]